MSTPSPPGTAANQLARINGTLPRNEDFNSLARRYRDHGIHLFLTGLPDSSAPIFVEILEAIVGFTRALDWVPSELRMSQVPPQWGFDKDVWLKVGSIHAAQAPNRNVAFGLTHWIGARPTLWFNPEPNFDAYSDSLSRTPFEVAVHELGHVTEGRDGAKVRINATLDKLYKSSDRAARFLSHHAVKDPTEVWAEATVGANTAAWARLVDQRSRDLLDEFVGEVSRGLNVRLI
jgi:hypothetical protein